MGHHHHDFASTPRALAKLLPGGDTLDLNPTGQRTDVPLPAECSLLSKSARYSLQLEPCTRSTRAAQLAARRYTCDPVRCSAQACHRSVDLKQDSNRSLALCPRSADQAERDASGGNHPGDLLG